ncbi:hypothetical protein SALCHL_006152 [Streptomyces albus subsp. chlorinus]|uniref:hypothetical protein n=1 Tax=Streptomyces albus TaxID=1888 RepID=UPI0031F6A907
MERRRFVAGALGAAAGGVLAGAAGQAWAGPRTPAHGPAPTARAASALAGWSAVPAPGSVPGAQLYKVAALGPRHAWAVGEEALTTGAPGRPLAMRWDGSRWSRTDVSSLTFSGRLNSVACDGPASAWAVGPPDTPPGRLLRWNGTAWRPVGYPGGDNAVLWAVAAGSGGQVWITGRHAGAARLLHWNGTRFRWLDPLPVPSPEAATLSSVLVRSQGDVWVTGSRSTESAWLGIVARWDGAWTVFPDAGGIRSGISGVLPLADDDVWAVGAGFGIGGPPGKPPGSILVHWDGTAWTSAPKDIGPGVLTSITADEQGRPAWISAWDFWDQKRTAYLRWDGTTWQVVRGPESTAAPSPYLSDLTRVPGTATYLSVGRTGATAYPPSEAYGETTTDA